MSLITISQDFGSGGERIAKNLAASLKLELYDDERLREEAIKMGIKEDILKGLEEKTPGFFDKLMGNRPDIYLDTLHTVVYKVAKQGTGIIVGHGSQVLLKDFDCALHVRVYAPENVRVKNLMEKEAVAEETAQKIIRTKDEEHRDFFKYAFQRSFNDVWQYDLVLNTGKISIDTATKLIADLSKAREIVACSVNVLDRMACLELEHKVHATLLEHGLSPRDVSIEVAKPGEVQIHGLIYTQMDKKKIHHIIKKIDGVSKVTEYIVVPGDTA